MFEDGSMPDSPKKTSYAPTRCLYKVSKFGWGLGSSRLTGKSFTYSSVHISCLLTVFLVCWGCCCYFFYPLGTYFSPIFASTLALGFAISFLGSPEPILPGFRTLPL